MKIFDFRFLLLFAALASMTFAARPDVPKGFEVEVLLYSGRPNPTFVVTDEAEIRSLVALARTLPASASAAANPAALGYHGLKLRNRSAVATDIDAIDVRGSAVAITAAGATHPELHGDATGALEKRLLALAQAHGALPPRVAAQLGVNR
jgi:hypothetical protein